MATAEQIVSRAKSFLGTKECPANSNNVVFNTDYYGHPVSGASYPWCCAFVWDIFRMCGASGLFYDGNKTAYCPTVRNWAVRSGLTVARSQARMGDLILFDWGGDGIADHIGIVESYENGVYHTIEGNTAIGNNSNGGEVMRRIRYAKDVQAIVRPRYSKTITDAGWKGDANYYLMNSRVREWQSAMNVGFDTNELEVDGQFGQHSQAFASTHLLWSGQTHDCRTAIKWLQTILREHYGFEGLESTGKWSSYLTTCVKEFQRNRALEQDGIVGLITTYWLLEGTVK